METIIVMLVLDEVVQVVWDERKKIIVEDDEVVDSIEIEILLLQRHKVLLLDELEVAGHLGEVLGEVQVLPHGQVEVEVDIVDDHEFIMVLMLGQLLEDEVHLILVLVKQIRHVLEIDMVKLLLLMFDQLLLTQIQFLK